MPKSLADGHIKVIMFDEEPVDWAAITLAEATAGVDVSAAILSNGFAIGPTDSDTVDEKSLADEGNVKVMTASNYDGNMTIFRYFNLTTGVADPTADALFQAVNVKGIPIWFLKRFTSKLSTAAITASDEYQFFECRPDNAQDAEATGYIKKIVPMQVDRAELNGVIHA